MQHCGAAVAACSGEGPNAPEVKPLALTVTSDAPAGSGATRAAACRWSTAALGRPRTESRPPDANGGCERPDVTTIVLGPRHKL